MSTSNHQRIELSLKKNKCSTKIFSPITDHPVRLDDINVKDDKFFKIMFPITFLLFTNIIH